MKTIGISAAKISLAKICRTVAETGEPVTITRKGKALVRLEPVRTIGERRSAYFKKYGALETDDPSDFQTPARAKDEFSFRAG